ncbi:MAG: LysR family transcriptional regulator [Bacteroides sp.]|jgi:LysR family hydrogen peroxide-inducible transcriptional activator|nr:LysR family transcriptional regulator [Bacteroides sp.]
MTLQQLEYILALGQQRHFGKAAEQCNVTQPTLSAMIQKLEEELGTKIFERNRQPIGITPVGQQIIEQAREVLNQADRIKSLIEEARQEVSGVFRLGILPTIAPYLLPRFFPTLEKKFPKLDIRVSEMKTSDIKQALLTGEIDAGILANMPDFEEYAINHLFYEQYYAYIAEEDALFEKDKIRTTDLATSDQLWLLDEGHCFRDQLVRFCQLKPAQNSQLTYRLGSMETFMRMVESGRGVTFIPELAVMQMSETQKRLVRPFAVPVPTRQLIMMTNKNYIRHTLLNAIIKEIQNAVPREMIKLRVSQAAL